MSTYSQPQARSHGPDTPHDVNHLDREKEAEGSRMVVVTFFTNYGANTKREECLSLEELAARIQATTAEEKACLPWLKCARFGDRRTDKGSLRHNANVSTITGIEADYDAGRISFEEAGARLSDAGVSGIVYTSPSYTEDAPRWRVPCPLSAQYPPAERDRFMARLNGLFGGIFSRESWVWSQSYYFGSVKQNPLHRVVVVKGTSLDLADELDAIAISKPDKPKPNGVNGHHHRSRPEDIADARISGLINSLLDNVRNAADGNKHNTLRDIARVLGGYLHLMGWSQQEAVEQLLGALPPSVQDWETARDTAAWGVAEGVKAPLELEDQPNPGQHRDGDPPGEGHHGADVAPATDDRIILTLVKGEYVRIAERIEDIAKAAKLPIYSHGAVLCRPVTEQRKRYDGRIVTVAVLRNYTAASLRRAIHPAMGFAKFDARRKSFVACEPPPDIISMVLEGGQQQVFPPIRGILGTPILRPDRTITASPGYDSDTGYYLTDPPRMPPIHPSPTREDAERALGVLADLLSEFPFVDDVSRAVAYSGLITPLVRPACDVVPGHLFTAPKQGSGKSLLVDTAAAMATGERAYAILAHRQPGEQDKQLTGAVLEGRQIIALDNLTGDIESPVLAQVTERENVSVRPLGTTQTCAVLNGFNTYLTGNNVAVAGDNTRRLLVGRIDPQIENPLDRTFEKPNPVTRVFADRGIYVAACLTIALAYIAHGRPHPLPPTPSYSIWSELVREPLVWLGLADPTDSMRATFEDDPANAALATLIAAWPTGQTDWTCAELIEGAMKTGRDGTSIYPGLTEALKPIARDRRGVFDCVVLGNYMRLNRDKIVDGKKISRRAQALHGGASRWFLTVGRA